MGEAIEAKRGWMICTKIRLKLKSSDTKSATIQNKISQVPKEKSVQKVIDIPACRGDKRRFHGGI